MKSLVSLVILCAALFVGACSNSSSSTAPSNAPLPTDSATPVESVEASPS